MYARCLKGNGRTLASVSYTTTQKSYFSLYPLWEERCTGRFVVSLNTIPFMDKITVPGFNSNNCATAVAQKASGFPVSVSRLEPHHPAGNVTTTERVSPSGLSARIFPLWADTMLLAMESPNP